MRPSLFLPSSTPPFNPVKSPRPPKLKETSCSPGWSKSFSPEFRRECPAREGERSRALVPTPPLAAGGSWEGHFACSSPIFSSAKWAKCRNARGVLVGITGQRKKGMGSQEPQTSPACSCLVSLWESEFTSLGTKFHSPSNVGIGDSKLPSGALDTVKRFLCYGFFGIGYLSACESPIHLSSSPAYPRPGTLSCALWYFWARM